MAEIFLKKFAIFFTILLICQECHGLLENQVMNIEDESKAVKQLREKRAFGAILIGISVASAGIDIYKQTAGCRHVTPSLRGKINDAKTLQKHLVAEKDRINLLWVPAESKESYARRLNSDLEILRLSIVKFDALQVDLLKLLDQNLLDKMNLLRRQIENDIDKGKDIGVRDFSDLEKKFYTTTQFALSLTFKLLPAGFLLGSWVLPRIATRFARNAASDWSASNPSRVRKMLNTAAERTGRISNWSKARINSIKNYWNTKWTNFKAKFPRVKAAFSRLANSRVGQALSRNMGKIKAGAKVFAKGVVVAVFVGIEVWNLIKFIKGCKDQLKKVNEAIQSLNKGKRDLATLRGQVNNLQRTADRYYSLMKGNLTSPGYLNYVKEVASLGDNAKEQTTEIVGATRDIKRYSNEITRADLKKTDQLNKLVISAFGKINFELDCLHSKLAIISALKESCSNGHNTFDNLYIIAKRQENERIAKKCIKDNYMDKNEIRKITTDLMLLNNKQPICIRNNPTKQTLVCSYWYKDENNNDIKRKVPGLTLNDVIYMVKACPPAPVDQKTKEDICVKKNAHLKPYNQISQEYQKYNQRQILQAYNECKLSSSSVNNICSYKNDGYTVDQILEEKKYSIFPKTMVQKSYDGCKKETNVTPNDKIMICFAKQNNIPLDSLKSLISKYEFSSLKKVYDSC